MDQVDAGQGGQPGRADDQLERRQRHQGHGDAEVIIEVQIQRARIGQGADSPGRGGHAGGQHQAGTWHAQLAIEDQPAGHEITQVGQEPGQEQPIAAAQRAPVQRIEHRHAQDPHHPQRAGARLAAGVQQPHQRREQVQAHDHVQVPQVVVGRAFGHLAGPEREVQAAVVPPVQRGAPGQVEEGPEQQRRAHAGHAAAVEAPRVVRLVRVQQQRAADHHEHGHAPARRGVVEVGRQPGVAAVGGGVGYGLGGAVQQYHGKRGQPAGRVQPGVSIFDRRHGAPARSDY
ncbi:Uncharacterised protein [Bordetella pertussis]|nr:Uncharacterised protein [Bordetella pertussis]